MPKTKKPNELRARLAILAEEHIRLSRRPPSAGNRARPVQPERKKNRAARVIGEAEEAG